MAEHNGISHAGGLGDACLGLTPSGPRKLEAIVPPGSSCKTVGNVLRSVLHAGTHEIRHAKHVDGGITLDGIRVHTNAPVSPGQVVGIVVGDAPEDAACGNVLASPGVLCIAYEDSDLLILDKPAGIATHPGPGHSDDTLANYVMAHLAEEGLDAICHPVHRIDKGTSGLVVFAKNGHAQARLQKAMHTPGFERTYIAICQGVPPMADGCIDAPIGMREGSRTAHAVSIDGKPASTHYIVLASTGDDSASLLSLQLLTGRTHQIRVHCAFIGCPLIGDAVYGVPDKRIGRPALHAARIALDHPVTGERLCFDSPLPDDMLVLARTLFGEDMLRLDAYGIIDSSTGRLPGSPCDSARHIG